MEDIANGLHVASSSQGKGLKMRHCGSVATTQHGEAALQSGTRWHSDMTQQRDTIQMTQIGTGGVSILWSIIRGDRNAATGT